MAEELAPGQQQEQDLRNGGYHDEDINAWREQTKNDLQGGGYSEQDVKDYFGMREPDMGSTKDFIKKNLTEYTKTMEGLPEQQPQLQRQAHDFKEAFEAGLQISIPGIVSNANKPDLDVAPDASWAMNMAKTIGQVGGDLPVMAAGEFVGGPAGAFGLPAALRKALVDHYEKGDIKDPGDFLQRAMGATWEGVKGAGIGVATSVAGGLGSAVAGSAGKFGAELATMTTAGKAMEGQLPTAQDFINGGALLAGFHAVGYITPKLYNIFAETGEHPTDVIKRAETDPVLKQELLTMNPDLPKLPGYEGHLENPDFEKEKAAAQAAAQAKAEPPTPEQIAKNPALSDDGKAMLDLIGKQDEAPKAGLKQRLEDWYAKNIDKTQILRDALNRAGVEPTSEDSARLLQLQSAASDTTKSFIENGTRDFSTGKTNGESFQSVLDDYSKARPEDPNLDGLKAFGIASRIVELGKRDINLKVDGKEVDVATAQRIVDAHPEMKQYMDRIVAFKNRTLDYMHDSGYFTPEQVEAMKELNKSHFSFKRVQDFDPISGEMGQKSANPVKRIYGEGGKLIDPILSTVRDTDAMLRLAEENRVRKQFVEDISKSENLDGFLEKVKPQLKPIRVQSQEIMRAFKDVDGHSLDGTTAEALTIFRPRDAVKMADQFEVHDEGQRGLYRTSPLVAEALNTISGQPQIASAWVKVLNGFSKTLSTLTVGNPLFAFRHIYRNIRTSPVYSQTGLRPFLDTMIHLPEYLGGGDAYKDFLYNGGSVGSVTKFDTDYVDNKIYELDKQAPFIDKAWNTVKDAAGFSHWAIVSADNATRFAEYQRTISQGKSPVEAAYNARNVIPDYQKAGLQRSALWSSAAFLRVHVTSEAAMFANLSKDPQGVIARSLLYFTVPSLMLYAANQGDKRIEDLPEWMKNTYETTGIDHWRAASGMVEAASVDPQLRRQMQDGSWQINDGPVLKMPQAFTLGTVFSRGPIAALESWKAKDPKGVEDWAKHVAGSLFAEPIPTAAVPMLEQYTNKNFFTGRPVVSSQNEEKMPMFQYKPYTTEVARQLGKMIGTYVPGADKTGFASPEVIDNYLRDWGGTMGSYALNLADKVMHASGIGNLAVQPATSIFEKPFVREFFATNRPGNSQAVQDYYDNFKETQSYAKSISALQKEGNTDDLQKLMNKYPERAFNMAGYEKAMNNLNHLVQAISEDSSKNYSANDKQQLITPLMGKMVQLAKGANQKYKAFQANVAQNRKAGDTN